MAAAGLYQAGELTPSHEIRTGVSRSKWHVDITPGNGALIALLTSEHVHVVLLSNQIKCTSHVQAGEADQWRYRFLWGPRLPEVDDFLKVENVSLVQGYNAQLIENILSFILFDTKDSNSRCLYDYLWIHSGLLDRSRFPTAYLLEKRMTLVENLAFLQPYLNRMPKLRNIQLLSSKTDLTDPKNLHRHNEIELWKMWPCVLLSNYSRINSQK